MMTLAREGWEIVGISLAAVLLATWGWGAGAWPLWLIFIIILQFFREPNRKINITDNEIISAADGKVVFIGPAKSPADGSETIKISVFMSVFNVHANRAPIAGTVLQSQRISGKGFLNAALDKASSHNERHMIVIDSVHGKVVCMQIAGLLARRVLCYANVGDALAGGQRYGFIRFGSRADIYLPLHLRLQVALGDTVYAGISKIAA